MSRQPLPDNNQYERLRGKFIRELDPEKAADYLEYMLAVVTPVRDLVQEDFDRVLDNGKSPPARRSPLCCRVQAWLSPARQAAIAFDVFPVLVFALVLACLGALIYAVS